MTTQRTALVTGASSGIGRATAQMLLDRGHRVIGTSRNPAKIPADERLDGVTYRALDLTDLYAIEGFVNSLGAEGYRVDIVVNNAGESQSGPLEELPIGALERLFHLNVLGPVHLTQLLLPGMRHRGYGRVVMVGSMLASFPLAYRSSYVATKAAIKGFATAARFEMAPYGVWLTTVEPGSINTGISQRRTKYIGESSPTSPRSARCSRSWTATRRKASRPSAWPGRSCEPSRPTSPTRSMPWEATRPRSSPCSVHSPTRWSRACSPGSSASRPSPSSPSRNRVVTIAR